MGFVEDLAPQVRSASVSTPNCGTTMSGVAPARAPDLGGAQHARVSVTPRSTVSVR
jgi:hypothetical protein